MKVSWKKKTTTTKTYRDGDWTQKKSSIFSSRGAWLSLVGWLCELVSFRLFRDFYASPVLCGTNTHFSSFL